MFLSFHYSLIYLLLITAAEAELSDEGFAPAKHY